MGLWQYEEGVLALQGYLCSNQFKRLALFWSCKRGLFEDNFGVFDATGTSGQGVQLLEEGSK